MPNGLDPPGRRRLEPRLHWELLGRAGPRGLRQPGGDLLGGQVGGGGGGVELRVRRRQLGPDRGRRAPVKSLKVLRRQRLMLVIVTGAVARRAAGRGHRLDQAVGRRCGRRHLEKIRPPTDHGEMMKAGTRNPAPTGRPPAGGAGWGGQGDELLGVLRVKSPCRPLRALDL